MKANMNDPWNESEDVKVPYENSFEDAFVVEESEISRLPDSDQYLERLYSRLEGLQKKSSKKDLVTSLTEVKEDYIARLITERMYLETEEEKELASNPVIKLVAPHLQALSASELVHLLKADVLQQVTTEQHNDSVESSETESTKPEEKQTNDVNSTEITEPE